MKTTKICFCVHNGGNNVTSDILCPTRATSGTPLVVVRSLRCLIQRININHRFMRTIENLLFLEISWFASLLMAEGGVPSRA